MAVRIIVYIVAAALFGGKLAGVLAVAVRIETIDLSVSVIVAMITAAFFHGLRAGGGLVTIWIIAIGQ